MGGQLRFGCDTERWQLLGLHTSALAAATHKPFAPTFLPLTTFVAPDATRATCSTLTALASPETPRPSVIAACFATMRFMVGMPAC